MPRILVFNEYKLNHSSSCHFESTVKAALNIDQYISLLRQSC